MRFINLRNIYISNALWSKELNEEAEPSSPAPSVDRLSVTWADIENLEKKIEDTLKSLEFTPGSPPVSKMEVRFPLGKICNIF